MSVRTIEVQVAIHEGLRYWWDAGYKQWLIHDGKQKLYEVVDKELITYLEANKKTELTEIDEIFFT
jgi:hypothetical protein